jgi:hypothetical protein
MLKLKERSTSSGAGAAEVATAKAPRRAVAMKLKEGIVAVVVDWWWCLLVFLRIDPVNYLLK